MYFLILATSFDGVIINTEGLRENYNIILLAIKRDERVVLNPSPDETFLPGDVLIVLGATESLAKLEIDALGNGPDPAPN